MLAEGHSMLAAGGVECLARDDCGVRVSIEKNDDFSMENDDSSLEND